jgi:hypothetical protein
VCAIAASGVASAKLGSLSSDYWVFGKLSLPAHTSTALLVTRKRCGVGNSDGVTMDATEELLPAYKDLFNQTNDIVHPLRAATSLGFDITAPINPMFGIISS